MAVATLEYAPKTHIKIVTQGLTAEAEAVLVNRILAILNSTPTRNNPAPAAQTKPEAERLWDAKKVCEYLGRGNTWLTKNIKSGAFPAPCTAGRRAWQPETIKKWLAHGDQTS